VPDLPGFYSSGTALPSQQAAAGTYAELRITCFGELKALASSGVAWIVARELAA